jgi:site-specific DNA-adenine methylase
MTSQKTLNVTINLPQDIQDIGFKELIIKRENGIHLISQKSRRLAAYISDINSELINAYVAVRDNVEKLIILLTQHEIE